MLEIIQDQVAMKIGRQIVAGIIENGGQRAVDRYDFQFEKPSAMRSNAPDLIFPSTVLLKDQQLLNPCLRSLAKGRVSDKCAVADLRAQLYSPPQTV